MNFSCERRNTIRRYGRDIEFALQTKIHMYFIRQRSRTRSCRSCRDAFSHAANREREILFPRDIYALYIDRDIVSRVSYRHCENISETRDVHLARARTPHSAPKTFSTISYSFVSTSPPRPPPAAPLDELRPMDVSIIRNVNFRRRNIIHTL